MVHRAGQRSIRNHPEIALPPLPDLIAVIEDWLLAVRGARSSAVKASP